MTRNTLWIQDPPKASAEDWAEVWERIIDLMPVEEEGAVVGRAQLLHFVLDDVLRRCSLEAEDRKPGILKERTLTENETARAWMEDFTE